MCVMCVFYMCVFGMCVVYVCFTNQSLIAPRDADHTAPLACRPTLSAAVHMFAAALRRRLCGSTFDWEKNTRVGVVVVLEVLVIQVELKV